MSKAKPIYLLAGGRGGGDMGPILKAVMRDIGVATPTIVYVGAANGDNAEFYERMAGMMKQVAKCRIVQAITSPDNADIQKAVATIRSADAVFVSGGDVEAGMEVLNKRGITGIFKELYGQGKLMFGVSAGSIMLAREWVRWTDPDDDSTAALFPCLGVAPVLCDTHGEGDDWEELKEAVKLSPPDTLGYGITSGTCLVVHPDAAVDALSGPIAAFARNGKKAARRADLKPKG
jgi:cyanophycinase